MLRLFSLVDRPDAYSVRYSFPTVGKAMQGVYRSVFEELISVNEVTAMPESDRNTVRAFRAGILTVSDSGSKGGRSQDISGDTISELITLSGLVEVAREIVPDELEAISNLLRKWSDEGEMDIILTTGGTGLGPRDVTPEATKSVIDIEVPGIAEAMRMETLKMTPFAMLSRSTAGVRSGCLIINLPGSPKGVRECLEIA
ncbi:uncharacterized protein METZ01_LOCUS309344, partial [marine metagenome]